MKYDVAVKVEGYVTVSVEAEDKNTAQRIAAEEVGEMDFGPLRDIEWEPCEARPNDRKPVYSIGIDWSPEGGDIAHHTTMYGPDLCSLKEQVVPTVLKFLLRDGYSDCNVFVTATIERDGEYFDSDEFVIDYKEGGLSSVQG